MKLKRILITLLLGMLFTGQTAQPYTVHAVEQPKQDFYEILQEANEKNSALDAPQTSLDQFCYNFKNDKPKLTEKDTSLMWQEYDEKKVKKTLSASDARKETNWLFRLLRSQYGLYSYYGGDAAFGSAKTQILKEIGRKGMVSTSAYQKILHKHLSFVTDLHLAIGAELFDAQLRLFGDESVHYVKMNGNYYEEGRLQDAVVKVNGKQPAYYFKRAIDENGSLTYYPYAMLKQKKDTCTFTVEYQSGKTKNIQLAPSEYAYKQNVDRLYNYETYDDLAYVEMNLAYMDWEAPKERKQFLKDVPDLKKRSQIIFDLRNNPGGDGSLIDEWFERFTGKTLIPNYSTLRIRPVFTCSAEELKEMDAFAAESGLKKSGKYYYAQYPGRQYLENEDRQIFVLTSRRTSSAAESMVDALKNLENVITIGTNTGGVLANMANHMMAMPYSGLYLQFGECLQYFDPSYFKEGYGMEPDVYLTGKNIEKRLKKFFKKYVYLAENA